MAFTSSGVTHSEPSESRARAGDGQQSDARARARSEPGAGEFAAAPDEARDVLEHLGCGRQGAGPGAKVQELLARDHPPHPGSLEVVHLEPGRGAPQDFGFLGLGRVAHAASS